jgi:hypothetical protein
VLPCYQKNIAVEKVPSLRSFVLWVRKIHMKVSVEHWWVDIDMGRRETFPSATVSATYLTCVDVRVL